MSLSPLSLISTMIAMVMPQQDSHSQQCTKKSPCRNLSLSCRNLIISNLLTKPPNLPQVCLATCVRSGLWPSQRISASSPTSSYLAGDWLVGGGHQPDPDCSNFDLVDMWFYLLYISETFLYENGINQNSDFRRFIITVLLMFLLEEVIKQNYLVTSALFPASTSTILG